MKAVWAYWLDLGPDPQAGLSPCTRAFQRPPHLKEHRMKTSLTLLASACALAAAATLTPLAAQAQDASPRPTMHGREPGMDHGGTRRAGVEQHIQHLQQRLHITAAQEPQWAEVAQAMRESAHELDTAMARRGALAQAGTVPATEALNTYGQMAQLHADSAKRLAFAFAPLYAVMSSEQQKQADEVFAQRAHPARK